MTSAAKGNAESEARDGADPGAAPRPQSLLLSFFGIHVLGRSIAVSSASIIDILGRAGVGEDAVRSTLTRMVGRDLLDRQRVGRKAYFGLTERSNAVLMDGQQRVWQAGVVNQDWDGSWTVVGFSLPDAWRSERHDLRSRLLWGGLGPLQSGMWAAPGRVDVAALVDGLGLESHLKVFQGCTVAPTEAGTMIATAFDIPAIARRHEAFLARWGGGAAVGGGDPLAGQLLLHTDWLDLVRRDPHLPVEYLPEDWPGVRAERVFRRLALRYEEPARLRAVEILDAVECGP
ncbi:PaaX family transcriptional regulator [Streptacidiphilus carbonis]|uniref:PaaX family transcriptional regulator n=1 Tax=Streptacidiphilus carbonis TaxID=105422 RepID=UPI000A3DAFA9|nr:PaaX family transcriptional regulator C-terminal domain-containing protein [Streptacidiphilus carbonis]